MKNLDPKASIGITKAPMHLLPRVAKIAQAMAHKDGADKYGAYNWREGEVCVSTYLSAIERHLDAYVDGEDIASDSGLNHLAHIMASCAIVLDAASLGKLVDDRPPAGKASEAQAEMQKVLEEKKDEK